MGKLNFFKPSVVKRLTVVLVIMMTVSTKLFCKLHIRGSLDYVLPVLEKEHKPWIKIKQDLIERKGLMWFLRHPDNLYVFLLNNESDCGLFVMGSDSAILCEIKKSMDVLSQANDTLEVNYAYSSYSMYPEIPFDSERFKSNTHARDSFDRANSDKELRLAKLMDSKRIYSGFGYPSRYWFLSDTMIYSHAKCLPLFKCLFTYDVIVIDSLRDQYVAECKKRNFAPILYDAPRYHDTCIEDILDRLNNYDDVNHPEIQILYKFIKKNDSIILNTPLSTDMYDINYVYDHFKTANLPPLKFGRKPGSKMDGFTIDVNGLLERFRPKLKISTTEK